MSERLSPEAEAELATRARAGDRAARDALVVANLPLAAWVVQRHTKGRRADVDDLVQAARVGLVLAADRFDPARGVRFGTYAIHWVRLMVRRAMRATASVVAPPHRAPHAPADVSLDAPIGEDGATRLDALADDGADPGEAFEAAEGRATVLAALDAARLDARERAILAGRAEDETLEALGARLGVTRERVRQIEHKARGRVARALRRAA